MTVTAKSVTTLEYGRIALREYTVPECSKNGLIMKVEMCGICGTDKHTYLGWTTQYIGTVNEQTSPLSSHTQS